jgi:hypothetical protein
MPEIKTRARCFVETRSRCCTKKCEKREWRGNAGARIGPVTRRTQLQARVRKFAVYLTSGSDYSLLKVNHRLLFPSQRSIAARARSARNSCFAMSSDYVMRLSSWAIAVGDVHILCFFLNCFFSFSFFSNLDIVLSTNYETLSLKMCLVSSRGKVKAGSSCIPPDISACECDLVLVRCCVSYQRPSSLRH